MPRCKSLEAKAAQAAQKRAYRAANPEKVRAQDRARAHRCAAKRATLHPLYGIWRGIKARCYNNRRREYPYYGGRGISMYPEWRASFMAFAAYVGVRPSSLHSIDRINNDGNYEPGNVRWATRREQRLNQRMRMTVGVAAAVDWDAQPLGVARDSAIAKSLGLRHQTVTRARVARGIAAVRGPTGPRGPQKNPARLQRTQENKR